MRFGNTFANGMRAVDTGMGAQPSVQAAQQFRLAKNIGATATPVGTREKGSGQSSLFASACHSISMDQPPGGMQLCIGRLRHAAHTSVLLSPTRASLPNYLRFGRTNSKFLNENSRRIGAPTRSPLAGRFWAGTEGAPRPQPASIGAVAACSHARVGGSRSGARVPVTWAW